MHLSSEPLSPTSAQEALLSKLPRAIILASHTGLEVSLANLLNEASIADCFAVSVREPLRDAIRGILFGGDPAQSLDDIDSERRKALEYEIEKAIKAVYGDEGLAMLAIKRAEKEKDWPTAVFCEGNDADNVLIREHFDGAAVMIYLAGPNDQREGVDWKVVRVEDGMSPNALLTRFCEVMS